MSYDYNTAINIAKQNGISIPKELEDIVNNGGGEQALFGEMGSDLIGDIIDFSQTVTSGDVASQLYENLEKSENIKYDASDSNLGDVMGSIDGKTYSPMMDMASSRTILENNGFNLSGFDIKEGQEDKDGNKIPFFEKTHADGTREFIRVVTGSDGSTKILNSIIKPGEEAQGRVYNAKNTESNPMKKAMANMVSWFDWIFDINSIFGTKETEETKEEAAEETTDETANSDGTTGQELVLPEDTGKKPADIDDFDTK